MMILPSLAGAAVLAALSAPPAASVTAASRAGSGCPSAGQIAAALAADRGALTAEFPPLTAAGGRGLVRTHCDVLVTLAFSPGWQVSPATVQLELAGQLPERAGDADVSYKVYLQGQPATVTAVAPLAGLADAPRTATLALAEAWSACGSTATIVQGLALRLKAGASGRLAVPRVGGLRLKWRPCP